jgi:hypothetical protein
MKGSKVTPRVFMSALVPKNDEVSSLSTKGQISRPVRYKAKRH